MWTDFLIRRGDAPYFNFLENRPSFRIRSFGRSFVSTIVFSFQNSYVDTRRVCVSNKRILARMRRFHRKRERQFTGRSSVP